MKRDIHNLIKSCISCQLNKKENKKAKAPMEITTTSVRPFQRLAIDIVGPLPITENGNRFIMTMQDDLTKFSYATVIPNHESKTLANEFVKFITIFGIPETILTDNGSDFTSGLIKEVNKLFKVRHILTSPYHPQSNGALERSHSTLKDYLKHYLNKQQTNWDEYVELAMFTYNTHIHASTKFTPFELMFGHKAQIPSSLTSKPEFKYTYDDYHQQLKLKLNQSFELARQNLIKNKETSKKYYDKNINLKQYNVNDLVLLKNNAVSYGQNKKLSPNLKDPFKIIKVNSNNTYQLELTSNKSQTYHYDMIRPYNT